MRARGACADSTILSPRRNDGSQEAKGARGRRLARRDGAWTPRPDRRRAALGRGMSSYASGPLHEAGPRLQQDQDEPVPSSGEAPDRRPCRRTHARAFPADGGGDGCGVPGAHQPLPSGLRVQGQAAVVRLHRGEEALHCGTRCSGRHHDRLDTLDPLAAINPCGCHELRRFAATATTPRP